MKYKPIIPMPMMIPHPKQTCPKSVCASGAVLPPPGGAAVTSKE